MSFRHAKPFFLINAFIAWRFVEWSHLGEEGPFESLDAFRSQLNNIEFFGDFVSIVTRESLEYSNMLSDSFDTSQALLGGPAGRDESLPTIRCLIGLIAKN